jgi:hypothetical protein
MKAIFQLERNGALFSVDSQVRPKMKLTPPTLLETRFLTRYRRDETV